MSNFGEKVGFIWSIADLLRGDYKPAEYADVILPLIVLRRLDCVLDPTKEAVRTRYRMLSDRLEHADAALRAASGYGFYNTSRYDFAALRADPKNLADNLRAYLSGFSPNVRDIVDKFGFRAEVERLDEANLLFPVVERFGAIDLHPEVVPHHEMGTIFEELIRRFSEQSNETAGEHFTPREVIRLMVNLLFGPDRAELAERGVVRTVYDPACGTGGMLTIAKDHVLETINPRADVRLFGQELNPKSYAVCKADMLIKGERDDNIKLGNSFSDDHLAGSHFNYMLSNPPFGVEWKKVQDAVKNEAKRGFDGRFGAGLPRINDGSFLFLQHLIDKLPAPEEGGGRIAIVFNGSPLFTGDAGSGESEIRRWIIEHDWLEAVVALPDQLFYNTGIHTFIWIVTNRKEPRRRGTVQLVNAVGFARKMRRSLGHKRNEIAPDQIAEITTIHADFAPGPHSRLFRNEAFGYRRVTIERPLRQNYQVSPERIARLAASPAYRKATGAKAKAAKAPLTSPFWGAPNRAPLADPMARVAEDAPAYDAGVDGTDPLVRLPEPGHPPEGQEDHPALAAVATMGDDLYRDRPSFERALTRAFTAAGVPLAAPLKAAILAALAERDETAEPVMGKNGGPAPDPDLRDTENVPLVEEVAAFVAREVLPHVPDAWVNEGVRDEQDGGVGKVGYEIPFTRHFYEYQPLRPLEEIDREIKALEGEILALLRQVTA